MESLYYLRGQILAASLTEAYNKEHYSYSAALWEANNIFREKRLILHGIYPVVKITGDNNILITAKLEVSNEIL